jgi:hypothetical protein
MSRSDSDWETLTNSVHSSMSLTDSEPMPVLGSDTESPSHSVSSDGDGDWRLTNNIEKINEIENLLKTDSNVVYEPTCVKKRSNWSKQPNLIDPVDPVVPPFDLSVFSPKATALLKNIRDLDERDQREEGKKFKHFIFTDFAKPLASAMISNGFTLGYDAKRTGSGKKKFGKIELLSLDPKSDPFYVLTTASIFDQNLSVAIKKTMLAKFNERPDNVYGENVRFIIMDSGFKEGIDLFDIKYIHVFEPQLMMSDLKQIIGRGTRTCGQKGLQFHPTFGWRLNVYIYDMTIPKELMGGVGTAFALYMKAMKLDMRLHTFTSELENETISGAVDNKLTRNIHNMVGGSGSKGAADTDYSQYAWEPVKMENLCEKPSEPGSAISLTPTQNFLKNYFVPTNPVKGMLLWHSTGSGKTCSAISVASNQFEKEGYTILWVTRATLKNDIWKNMFDQVCHEVIRAKLSAGEIAIPSEQPKRMKLLSKSWRIRPMSYKQFTNLVEQKNQLYDTLVKINGPIDPLRKTLLVIDEAQKLYGGAGLSSLEQPDMVALHKAIMNSYIVSGQDSVRLLMMTATPITASPMELVQLLNLCKAPEQQMPTHFEDFAKRYLDVETGKFRPDSKYKDDIAGCVSYLNREKDARQFAIPVIKQITTPMVALDDVLAYDKRSTRDLMSSGILELKSKIEKTNKSIITDLDVNRFKELKAKCVDRADMKKECRTIARRNMRDLVKEAKEEMDKIKEEIKAMREELKNKNLFKMENLKQISDRIEANSPEYHKFKQGIYYNVRSKCGKTIHDSKSFDELADKHPTIIPYVDSIREQDEKIAEMENLLKTTMDGYKNKLHELKKMLKTNLSDLERSVVKLVIKDHQKTIKSRGLEYNKILKERVEEANVTKRQMEKGKKKQMRTLKNTYKSKLREEKAHQREFQRADKKLRKVMRQQDDYKEEIKEDLLKGLVTKYTERTEQQIEEKRIEITDKIAARQAKKNEKANAKAAAKAETKTRKAQARAEVKDKKAQEKADRKTRKAQEKAEVKDKKAQEKSAVKDKKAQEKAETKTRKAQEKALAKAETNTRKAQEKALAKAENKTRKAQEKAMKK